MRWLLLVALLSGCAALPPHGPNNNGSIQLGNTAAFTAAPKDQGYTLQMPVMPKTPPKDGFVMRCTPDATGVYECEFVDPKK